MSSDEKDSASQRSFTSNSVKKSNSDSKNKKLTPESKLSAKNMPYTDEATLNNEYFESQITSLEPKDVSDRMNTAFNNYLSQVTSMYFGSEFIEPKETLNEVSSRIMNNHNELLTSKKSYQMEKESGRSEMDSSLVSNDFHYSTLDML